VTAFFRCITAIGAMHFACACIDTDPPSKAPLRSLGSLPMRIRDSAGIRIVEYPSLSPEKPPFITGSPFPQQGWARIDANFSIDTVPYRDIGGSGNEIELDPVYSAAFGLSSDRTMIADANRLILADSANRILSVSGRRGSGPGEFQQVLDACRTIGDTVLTVDALRRVSVWTAKGKHIRTVQKDVPIVLGSCDRRGQFLSVDGPAVLRMPADGGQRFVEYVLRSSDGKVVEIVGKLPGALMAGIIVWDPAFAWSDDELVIATGRTYELIWRRPDRTIRQIVRFTGPAPYITEAEWETLLAGAVPRGSTPENRKWVEGTMGPTPRAPFPPHGIMKTDPQRRVWLSDFADASRWTVFSHDGMLVGRFKLKGGPPFTSIVEIGKDYVQVRESDPEGFTHLRFYRLRERR